MYVARAIVSNQRQGFAAVLDQCHATGKVQVVTRVLTEVYAVDIALRDCGRVASLSMPGLLHPSRTGITYPLGYYPVSFKLLV